MEFIAVVIGLTWTKALACGLALATIFSGFGIAFGPWLGAGSEGGAAAPQYTDRAPIFIDSNVAFTAGNGVTGGDGSAGNPYVISGWNISAGAYGDYCIRITGTTAAYEVVGCQLSGAYGDWSYGALVLEGPGGLATNNHILDSGVGIWLGGDDVRADGNLVEDCGRGVAISASTNSILNNTIRNCSQGISNFWGDMGAEIMHNDISGNGEGIYLGGCGGGTVSNNQIESGGADITLVSSSAVGVVANTMLGGGIMILGNSQTHWDSNIIALSNTVGGRPVLQVSGQIGGVVDADSGQVILANCSGVTVRNQSCGNVSQGISLGYCDNCTVEASELDGCSQGVLIEESVDNAVTACNFTSNEIGIVLDGNSGRNAVEGNALRGNRVGIQIDGGFVAGSSVSWNVLESNAIGIRARSQSAVCEISNDTLSGNGVGISLDGSRFADVRDCNVSGGTVGVAISGADNNRVFGCDIWDNDFGVTVDDSHDNYLGGNTIANCTRRIGWPATRTFEGGLDVNASDLSQVDMSVTEGWLTLLADYEGFRRTVAVDNASVFDVAISGAANAIDLDLAIFLDGAAGQPLDGDAQWQEIVTLDICRFNAVGSTYGTSADYCYCADADADEALRLYDPPDGTYIVSVVGYTLAEDPAQFDMAIDIERAASTGLVLRNSTANSFANCNFTANIVGANASWGSSGNRIWMNNFVGNPVGAWDDGVGEWNASYPLGGNYWDDYAGFDLNGGAAQDAPPADGFGDTPYAIGGGNQDCYPVMALLDGIYTDASAPVSSARLDYVDNLFEYCIVEADAADDYSGIADVELWWRHLPSLYGIEPWTNWTEYDMQMVAPPGTWFFAPTLLFGTGQGIYEFYTVATDHAGNREATPTEAQDTWYYDTEAPTSAVDTADDEYYWVNGDNLAVGASAFDNVGVGNVTLRYRYSDDQETWGNWTDFETGSGEPFAWSFDFPAGEGHYELCTFAVDLAGNPQAYWSAQLRQCGYDGTAPNVTEHSEPSATTGDAYLVEVSAMDDWGYIMPRVVYRVGSEPWTNVSMEHEADGYLRTKAIEIPPDMLDALQFYVVAEDLAHNWAVTPLKTVNVTDDDAPDADAGADVNAIVGRALAFNGSGSTDNIGIATMMWNFTDGGANVSLNGTVASYTFDAPGVYVVELAVMDDAGNVGTDIVNVTVSPPPDVTRPAAYAGEDIAGGSVGQAVEFNGSGSIDDVGIVNYTWTFAYNGTATYMFGEAPTFVFWTAGEYAVELNVSDAAGNWDVDSVIVTVNPLDDPLVGLSPPIILYIAVGLIVAVAIASALYISSRRGRINGPKGGANEPASPADVPNQVAPANENEGAPPR
jgi:parallel beta-helix repeat protein